MTWILGSVSKAISKIIDFDARRENLQVTMFLVVTSSLLLVCLFFCFFKSLSFRVYLAFAFLKMAVLSTLTYHFSWWASLAWVMKIKFRSKLKILRWRRFSGCCTFKHCSLTTLGCSFFDWFCPWGRISGEGRGGRGGGGGIPPVSYTFSQSARGNSTNQAPDYSFTPGHPSAIDARSNSISGVVYWSWVVMVIWCMLVFTATLTTAGSTGTRLYQARRHIVLHVPSLIAPNERVPFLSLGNILWQNITVTLEDTLIYWFIGNKNW